MTSGMDEPNRVVGRDGVEICCGDITVFGKLALVPPGAVDPFAGLEESDLRLDTGDDFNNRSSIGKPDSEEFIDAPIGNVSVSVDEARSGGVALEIDNSHAGGFACEFQDFGVGTDFHNHAVADGDGLSN